MPPMDIPNSNKAGSGSVKSAKWSASRAALPPPCCPLHRRRCLPPLVCLQVKAAGLSPEQQAFLERKAREVSPRIYAESPKAWHSLHRYQPS